MKHSRVSPSLPSSLSLVLCGLTVLSASAVRAAECPASSPDRTEERRALAKEWFARAEAAENANNDVEAVRAYACSMKMVAHAFTAFNLGRVAERSGDLELALKSYKAYLTLKADAPDKDEVQNKIADLQAKIKEVKENVGAGEPPAETTPGSEKPEEAITPPPEKPEKPLPIEPPPYVTEQAPGGGGASRILVWVVGGVGVAALGTGIITNIIARNDMDTCVQKADGGYLAQAKAACDSAKPAAYTSYAMFGVAGAAAVVEGILLYRVWSRSSGGESSDDTSVSLGWLPGGLSLSARGRF